jgi:hypothetical protein
LWAVFEGVGGGGGGGGCAGVATANAINGGGPASGATYSKRTLSISQIGGSATVTVGGGGNGGVAGANNGQPGGASSVSSALYGTIINCPGGIAGAGVTGVASFGQGAAAPSAGTGDISVPGSPGIGQMYTAGTSQAIYHGNSGGHAGGGWGFGGRTTLPAAGATAVGFTGIGYGGGGSGAIFAAVAANAQGGAGTNGAVMVTEYGFFATPYAIPTRGALSGLTLNPTAATVTFAIAGGTATDSTGTDYITLPSNWTKTSAAWVAGSGNGALDTGTIATAQWYHVHVIKNPTNQQVDVLLSRSPSAPTMPSGFTLSRRIGSMFYGATGPGWLGFFQDGDVFRWSIPRADVAGVSPVNGAQNNVTLTVPGDSVVVEALLMASCQYLSGGGTTLKLFPGNSTAQPTIGLYAAVASNSNSAWCQMTTNGSSVILSRLDYGGAGTAYSIETLGWIDRRGRDGGL